MLGRSVDLRPGARLERMGREAIVKAIYKMTVAELVAEIQNARPALWSARPMSEWDRTSLESEVREIRSQS